MSELLEKQCLFPILISTLILFANNNGYKVSFGDAYRDPRAFGKMGEKRFYGNANSAHKQRLAVDLNLIKDGKYLTSTEDHRFLGEHWKTLHKDARWGGDFNTQDGNHYSLEHNGIS